jgi:hypothetical protein
VVYTGLPPRPESGEVDSESDHAAGAEAGLGVRAVFAHLGGGEDGGEAQGDDGDDGGEDLLHGIAPCCRGHYMPCKSCELGKRDRPCLAAGDGGKYSFSP